MPSNGIKIKINCDIRGAEKAVKRLEDQVGRLQKAESKVGHLNENYRQFGNEVKKAYAAAEKALKKYNAAEDRAKRRLGVVEQSVRAKNPNATRTDFDAAIENDTSLRNLDAAAEAAAATYAELNAKAESMAQKHTKLGATLQQARQQLAAERTATQALREEINHTDFVVSRLRTTFSELGRRIATSLTNSLARIPEIAKATLGRATSFVTGSFKRMARATADMAKKITGAAAKFITLRRASRSGAGAVQGFSKAIIKLGTMLKMLVVRQAMRAMIKAAKEGFENLAQYSTRANANMSALMSSMTQLKNSFATVFEPLLSVVTPALNTFIGKLSEAVSSVSALFAALSGAKTFTKATVVTEDYAASLDAAGSSAKNAKKSFSFDTLNQIQDSSGGGYTGPTPAEMFEDVDVPTWISGLVDMIKAEDWPGLGAYISEAINKGITTLRLMVSWGNVNSEVTRVVSGITGTLNAMIQNIDWAGAGAMLAAGVNTLINTLYRLFTGIDWVGFGQAIALGLSSMILSVDWVLLGASIGAWFNIAIGIGLGFVQNFDWAGAGLSLANALSGMVQSINWAGVGALISNLLIGAFTFLYTAVENFDWFTLGENVKTMLVNIDWGSIFSAMCQAMGAAFGGMVGFLWGLLHDAWANIVTWWQETAYEDGKFTILGLLQGIIDVFVNIGTWIYDHIFKPFIDGFKNVFGIHSPSTVMAEMGRYLIDGLKVGLTGLWDKVSEIFTDALNGIRNTFSIENLKSIGSNAVSGLMNGLKSIGSKAVEWGSGILNSIKDVLGIHSPSTETEAVGEYTVAGYINGLNAYQQLLIQALTDMANLIVGIFTAAAEQLLSKQTDAQNTSRSILATWMSTVQDMFKSFYAGLSSQADSWAIGLQSTLNRMVSAAQQAAAEIAAAQSSSRTSNATASTMSGSPARAVSVRTTQASTMRVPAYATGKILPANQPHLAIVGDHTKGTSIETQLSTIEAAVTRAMQVNGGSNSNRPLQIDIYLDTGARFGRAIIPSIEEAIAGRSVTMTAKGGGLLE